MEVLNTVGRLLNLLSILLLGSGLIIYLWPGKKSNYNWFPFYVAALLTMELLGTYLGVILKVQNHFLIPIASGIHFGFLVFLFYEELKTINRKTYLILLYFGAVSLVVYGIIGTHLAVLQALIIVIYSFPLVSLGLLYFWKTSASNQRIPRSHFSLIACLVFYFSLEILLAFGRPFLAHQSLLLIAWFWFLRVLLLQLFYLTLIYFVWNKTR